MANRTYESIQSEIARLQKIAKQLEKRSTAAKQRARRKVFALMKKLGLTLIDLADGAKSAPRAKPAKAGKAGKAAKPAKATRARRTRKVPIKYKGPARGQTWTGRGRTPRWMAALIAEGKKKEDFLIKD